MLDKLKSKIDEVVRTLRNNTVKYKNSRHLGHVLLCNFTESLLTRTLPDIVETRSSISGGGPRQVAIKYLSEESLGAWSDGIIEDSVTIECSSLCGISDGDGIFEFSISNKEAAKKEYSFLLLTTEETEEAISLISEYIELDIEDYRGNRLGAMYCIGVHSNTSNSVWNEYVTALDAIEKKKEEEYALQKNREIKKVFDSLSTDIKNFENILTHSIEEDENNDLALKIDGQKTIPLFTVDKAKQIKRSIISYYNKILPAYNKWLKEVNRIRKGESAIIRFSGAVEYNAYVKDNAIDVPSNLSGHVIGKEGKKIKELSKIIGQPLQVNKVKSVKIPAGIRLIINCLGYKEKPIIRL